MWEVAEWYQWASETRESQETQVDKIHISFSQSFEMFVFEKLPSGCWITHSTWVSGIVVINPHGSRIGRIYILE